MQTSQDQPSFLQLGSLSQDSCGQVPALCLLQTSPNLWNAGPKHAANCCPHAQAEAPSRSHSLVREEVLHDPLLFHVTNIRLVSLVCVFLRRTRTLKPRSPSYIIVSTRQQGACSKKSSRAWRRRNLSACWGEAGSAPKSQVHSLHFLSGSRLATDKKEVCSF